MKRVKAGILLLAFLAPVSVVAADDDGTGFYYYYYKEKIPLTEMTGVVAVLDGTGAAPEELADLLDAAGYAGSPLRPHALRDWWIAELRSASDPPAIEGVATVIARLLRLDQPPRFFFSPVFYSPVDPDDPTGDVIITPDIFAKFEEGVGERRIDELLKLAGAPGAPREPFGGLHNTFKIATQRRSGIDVLDIANCLALFPEVVFSEPNVIFSGAAGGGAAPAEIPVASSLGLLVLGLVIAVAAVACVRGGRHLPRTASTTATLVERRAFSPLNPMPPAPPPARVRGED